MRFVATSPPKNAAAYDHHEAEDGKEARVCVAYAVVTEVEEVPSLEAVYC